MLTASTRLGPYEVVGPLGAGGMGEVYRARDTRLGREVAVKVLPEPFASSPDRLARFEREAKAVAALSHPNILAIHDYGSEGPVAHLACRPANALRSFLSFRLHLWRPSVLFCRRLSIRRLRLGHLPSLRVRGIHSPSYVVALPSGSQRHTWR